MQFETFDIGRVILRLLTPEHYKYIFSHYTNDELKGFLGVSSDEALQIERNKSDKGFTAYNRSMRLFQVIDKVSGRVIGACGLHNWYADHRRSEIGYHMMDESFKNKGIMSEVLAFVVNYGFTVMHLHRIEALIGTQNMPSQKLVKKLNFKQEGLLKEHYFVNSRFEDSMVFALLKSEYSINNE
ncbi:MAG: GNAT family protein [Bacteroidota bacterium]